jgi:hypothetical protein
MPKVTCGDRCEPDKVDKSDESCDAVDAVLVVDVPGVPPGFVEYVRSWYMPGKVGSWYEAN